MQHNPRHQISNHNKIKNIFLNLLHLGKISLYNIHTTAFLHLFNNSSLNLITHYCSDKLVQLFSVTCHHWMSSIPCPIVFQTPKPPPYSAFGTGNMVVAWPWAQRPQLAQFFSVYVADFWQTFWDLGKIGQNDQIRGWICVFLHLEGWKPTKYHIFTIILESSCHWIGINWRYMHFL